MQPAVAVTMSHTLSCRWLVQLNVLFLSSGHMHALQPADTVQAHLAVQQQQLPFLLCSVLQLHHACVQGLGCKQPSGWMK